MLKNGRADRGLNPLRCRRYQAVKSPHLQLFTSDPIAPSILATLTGTCA
jgi:hypothetical protein